MPHRTHKELLVFKDERYHSSYQVDGSLKNLDFIPCTVDCLHLSRSVVHHLDCLHQEQSSVNSYFPRNKTYMADQEYQILGLGFAQLSEVIEGTRREEMREIVGDFEEHVQLLSVVMRYLGISKTFDLFLELEL